MVISSFPVFTYFMATLSGVIAFPNIPSSQITVSLFPLGRITPVLACIFMGGQIKQSIKAY
jgi:hypothetical protein